MVAMTSLLDHPAVSENLFYPRPAFRSPRAGMRDLMVEVAPGVRLHARLHEAGDAVAHVVLFHGNGEVVSDYDDAAGSFARAGAALSVIDYRGYGRSEGQPSLRTLLTDARPAFEGVRAQLSPLPVIVMGRSLGSACAAELCGTLPEAPAGIIFESGFSDVAGFARRRGLPASMIAQADIDAISPLKKLAGCHAPLLVLHGELDQLIPSAEGRAAYEASAAKDKRLALVPGRGHNDVSLHEVYWEELTAFVGRTAMSSSQ
jgi:fermentation-respiration switch protein FrsA (DUF1100 family)